MKHRYQIFTVVLFLALASSLAFAQPKTISGTIKDPGGNGLPGVNVIVKGTSIGTTSDADGRYSITANSTNDVLVFSFIGFASKEVSVGSQSAIDVTLSEDIKELNEVVVTALGIERNTKALQSSVTQVSGENFTQAREISTANALAGRVAGVNVTKIASGPGGSSRVVIRGAKTLGSGYNQPLYVVDGIPMDNNNFGQSGVWGGADQGDGMSSINPDDIQSITVLKGAASAALYGSRAANGVILITTKKGTGKKGIGVEFNSNYVFEKVQNFTDFQHTHGSGAMTGPDLASRVATKASTLAQLPNAFDGGWGDQAWGPKFDGSDVVQLDGVTRKYNYVGDNWSRYYNTGTTATNSLSFTGGSDTQNFRFSFANLNNKGIIPNSGFDRVNLSIASNSKFGKKVTLVTKVMYSNEKAKNRPNVSDSPGNGVQSLYNIPGDVNVTSYKGDPNKLGAVPEGFTTIDGKSPGEEFQGSSNLWGQNPYWTAYQFQNTDVRDRVIASGQLRYDITDFLYAQGKAGMDWYTKRGTQLTPQGTGYQRGGAITEYENRNREINLEYTLGFNKAFGKFNVNAFLGGNRMSRNSEYLGLNGNNFNVPFFAAINNAALRNYGYVYGQSGINSLFGSAEIAFNNYLFLTATTRKDWFSQLNPQHNFIVYPSIGMSFVFSDAITSLPTWLSFGKVRASWARVGNANSVHPYDTKLNYSLGQNHLGRPLGYFTSANTTNAGNLPNRDLIPFLSTETEVGLDIRFFENRLGFDLTYYSQKTTNDILDAGISRASGFATTSVNLGELTNKGVEALITGTPVKGALTWEVSLNFAKNVNKVVSLIAGQDQLFVEEPRTRTAAVYHVVGRPYGMILGLKQQTTPDGKLVFDSDGAPLTSGKYEILGNGVPNFTGGLNNSLTYKQFNLAFLIDFKSGGQIYSGTNVRMTEAGFTKQTLQGRDGESPLTVTGAIQNGEDADGKPIYEPFTKTLTPGEAQNYWQQLGERSQDRFMYDASFIKLRQLTLGYSIPRHMLSKTPLQALSISFVGRNLALLYKKAPNIDPEATYTSSNAQGLDYFGMPATRTYGFNLRASF